MYNLIMDYCRRRAGRDRSGARVAAAQTEGRRTMATAAGGRAGRKAGGHRIVTANRLGDGAVVFLCDGGRWSERVADAVTAVNDAAAAELMQTAERDVAARRVVGPYLIEAVIEGGALQPLRLRELIRARGPTVRRDLGIQATADGAR